MRLGHALVLARMLMVFFVRKVLSVGALRSRGVRVGMATGLVLLAVLSAGAAYFFLRPMAGDLDTWRLVLQTTTVSALMWTAGAFLFVKVLFLNSEGLLELSFHFPLTGRERAVALLVYEATMVLAVAGAGLFSISTASILVLGLRAPVLLLETIVLPVALTYLTLSLVHTVVLRVTGRTPLRRVAHLVAILAVFVLLLTYARHVASLVLSVSRRYLAHESGFTLITAPTWLADRYGAWALAGGGLALVAALVVAVLLLAPRQYVRSSRYLKVWPGSSRRPLLNAYDRCLLRSSQTWLAGFASAAVLVALCLRPAVNPLWALGLLSMGGFYQFAATEPLRAAGWDRGPAWRIYARLLRAQLLLLALGTAGSVLVVAALVPGALAGAVAPIGGAAFGAVLTTFVGVLFPTQNDNPLSAFIGLSATAGVALVLVAALGVLRLERPALAGVLLLVTASLAAYTVIEIRFNLDRSRHEEVVAGPQQRRGRSGADRRRGCGNVALPDVLDG